MTDTLSDSELSEEEQLRARQRFEMLRPHLEDGIPLSRIIEQRGLVLRTAQRWIQRYRKHGWIGLARKPRNDKGKRRTLPLPLEQKIAMLALESPTLSAMEIYRYAQGLSIEHGWREPKYSTVYDLVRRVRETKNLSSR